MALKASELTVGDEHSEVVADNLTRTQIVQYAGASGDYNPVHTDTKFTKEIAGYPSVFAHGMLSMGATGVALTNYVGQSVVMSLVATSYGFGLFGDLSRFQIFCLAVAAYLREHPEIKMMALGDAVHAYREIGGETAATAGPRADGPVRGGSRNGAGGALPRL